MVIDMVETTLKRLRDTPSLPVRLRSWDIDTGQDANGFPAIWLQLKIEDTHLERKMRQRFRELVRDAVRDAVRQGVASGTSEEPWVYVNILTRPVTSDR